jgi:hypothetical protein
MCLVLRGLVMLCFADNGGPLVAHHFVDNLRFWMMPSPWFVSVAFMVTIAATFRRFAHRPELLRDGVWLFVPFFGLQLCFGFPGEIRVFYEVLPVFCALGYASLVEWMGTPVAAFRESTA